MSGGPLNIIVPIFNRPDYTRTCLEALASTDPGVEAKVILPTNGSRGSTLGMIRSWAEEHGAVVVEMDKNKGFAGGVNAGVAAAGPGRIMVMHNDVIVTPGWAAEMCGVMDEEEDAGVVTCRTNYANEHSVCVPDLRKRFGEAKPSNKERLAPEEIALVLAKTYPEGLLEAAKAASEASRMRYQYNMEVASHCMLVREGLFAEFGGFDEDFFPRGFEDKFWFQSLEQAGLACFVSNRAYVHHFGNITSDGPGFDFASIMRANEAKFKAKSEERVRGFGRITGAKNERV